MPNRKKQPNRKTPSSRKNHRHKRPRQRPRSADRPPRIPGGSIPSGELERAVAYAESKLGTPYVWATAGPHTHDCSGLIWAAGCAACQCQLDHELRSSHHQFNVWGEPVDGPVQRGDLVFFDTMCVTVMGHRASHVGIALGDGRFIHAANERLGVRYDQLTSDWYRPRFIGARRVWSHSSEELPHAA